MKIQTLIPAIAILLLTYCVQKEITNPFYGKLETGSIKGSFSMDGYIVWGASVIQHDDGLYYMFASVWPASAMGNWVTNSVVALAMSNTPEGPYEFVEYVLPPRGRNYWDGMMSHNPTIVKHNDTYYLFYTGTTYDFELPEDRVNNQDARYALAWNNKRIGVATATHPAGPWTRYDNPLITPRDGKWDEVITSNPAPVIHKDGSVTLIYKSVNVPHPDRNVVQTKDGLPRFIMGVARAESVFGEYSRLGEKDGMITVEGSLVSMEDPYVWFDGKMYHMIIKNFDPVFNTEGMGAIYLWSDDAINWKLPADNAGTYSLNVTWKEGFTTTQRRLERPQLLFENGKPVYLFLATHFREEYKENIPHEGNIYNVVFRVKGH